MPGKGRDTLFDLIVFSRKRPADIARLLDVSRGAVGNWIHGDSLPQRRFWPALAEILGVTLEELGAAIAQTFVEGIRQEVKAGKP